MTVTILGQQYEVEVQYHKVDNITYVLLDAPVFRKQTKEQPYPPRMDDLESAIYYSAWNQCIAETTRRFPIDLYHINDYHGAAALLHLLPKTIPACLSLHNAEFQGMWPMRTPAESKEVCAVFNLDPEVVARYVQYGSVFNLLHAGASYLRVHQQGFGAVGVSKKYGARAYARYPIFWGLSHIGQLPNPDPTDTAEWNKEAFMKDNAVSIDREFEASRAGLKRQAQEWAGLEINPKADLFVFVGRWSLQKGVDLIADIFPSILEQFPDTQLVCIGPLIDLYGKFAALKLAKLMEQYPGRVYSKPEFTALPPYIFSGAEFALIPSRDEPFGLVAVEFGRKGALGVGARVGGLGQMPGWWYTIESMGASHLLAQFKEAIVSALETKRETRALMRAWSAKQRFPVAQWLEDLETLQATALDLHDKPRSQPNKLIKPRPIALVAEVAEPHERIVSDSPPRVELDFEQPSSWPLGRLPYHIFYDIAPSGSTTPDHRPAASRRTSYFTESIPEDTVGSLHSRTPSSLSLYGAMPEETRGSPPCRSPSSLSLHGAIPEEAGGSLHCRTPSSLSLHGVVQDRSDFKLQQVDPFFTDSNGEFYSVYGKRLSGLTANNSTTQLCIEEYLVKSEKEWFGSYREAKLGRYSLPASRRNSTMRVHVQSSSSSTTDDTFTHDRDPREFGLAEDYKPPTGFKK